MRRAMPKFIEIQCSCSNLEEARHICRQLVQERLVACAQITPVIESIYIWNNQLETCQESKISLKARAEHYEQIRAMIEKNSSYQVPEILYRHIEGGNCSYLEWMETTTAEAKV